MDAAPANQLPQAIAVIELSDMGSDQQAHHDIAKPLVPRQTYALRDQVEVRRGNEDTMAPRGK